MKIESHRDLIVWQKAMDLAVELYRLSARLAAVETYRLASQLARAAASIPANIAEGHARGTRKDYANFLALAKGSLMEAETYLMLSIRLKFLKVEETGEASSLINEVSKMLTSLRRRLLAANPAQ